jgi:hypothetical protein
MSRRQFADPVFKPGHGLLGDAPGVAEFVLEGKPKKRSFPRPRDSTLLLIDLELEMAFNETGQALHDPVTSLFAAHVDVTIIRVPNEPMATPRKLPIQLIQHEIREQWGERAPLRGSFPTFLEEPVIEHTSC